MAVAQGTRLIGRLATLEISKDCGVTWLPIECLVDIDFNTAPETIDAACRDDNGGKFPIVTGAETTIDFNARYDKAGVAQQCLAQLSCDKETSMFRFRPCPGVGNTEYVGEFSLSDYSISFPLDDVADLSASFSVLGELACGVQTV